MTKMVSTILTSVIKCLSRIKFDGMVTWPKSGWEIEVAEAGISEHSIVVSKLLLFVRTALIISVEMSLSPSLLLLFCKNKFDEGALRPT